MLLTIVYSFRNRLAHRRQYLLAVLQGRSLNTCCCYIKQIGSIHCEFTNIAWTGMNQLYDSLAMVNLA